MKVRIEKNKTTCTIKNVTKENVGNYVCKAVSDVGLAVTKAKLYVQDVPKKKELEVKIAEEQTEKVKKERVKIEKKEKIKKPKRSSETTTELEETVEIKEVTPIETTESLENIPEEGQKAKPVLPIQSPLQTEAIASCKKIDDTQDIIEKDEEKAKELLSPTEPLYVEESLTESTTDSLKEKKKPKTRRAKPSTTESASETATIAEVRLEEVIERVEQMIAKEQLKMAKEITEVLETIRAKEFGPGEIPLREIAEIGYLVRHGISTKEVSVLYYEDKFPALKTPEAQSALVNVVERKGHGPLISEIITEERGIDEKELAATVGFRAFMKMVELKHATIEEVLTSFVPEDFVLHAWETLETTEVIHQSYLVDLILTCHSLLQDVTKSEIRHTAIVEETEVLIGEYLCCTPEVVFRLLFFATNKDCQCNTLCDTSCC